MYNLSNTNITSQELRSFLVESGFNNLQILNEYIDKVQKSAEFIIIRDGSSLIGISIFYANRIECDFAYITYIAVNPSYRRMGIGNKLIECTISFAKQKNFCFLRLEVFKNNIKALSLYIKCGFYIYEVNDKSFFMQKNIF